MKKMIYSLLPAAMMALATMQATEAAVKVTPWRFEDTSMFISGVSKNMNWVVGECETGNHSSKLQVMDVVNSKLLTYDIDYIIANDGAKMKVPSGAYIVSASVTDDGKMVGGSILGAPGYWKDRNFYLLEFPNNRKEEFDGYECTVTKIINNGEYMLGFAFDQSYDIKPAMWKDGKLIHLSNLPEADWKGNTFDSTDREEWPAVANMRFVDMSHDKRYLLGGMSTNHPGWGCCYFLYDMQNSTWEFLGVKELNNLIATGVYLPETEVIGDLMPVFSEDGSYIAGNVRLVKDNGTAHPTDLVMPFLYNVKTKKFDIYNEDASNDVGVGGVTNNGEIVAMSSITSASRSVVFRKNNMWYTLENILDQAYNKDYNVVSTFEGLSGTPFAISGDGKKLCAMSPGSREECYVIELDDKSFFDACASVNMLKNWVAAPTPGAAISTLDKIQIRFERAVDYVNGKKITITDNAGKVVAESTKVDMLTNSTDKRFREITFPSVKFENGKTYKVTIPAGTFSLDGVSSMVNSKIEFSYDGRAAAPVAPVKMTPADGASVVEIGVNNMVTLLFDMPVQVKDGATGNLYAEGNDTPLCKLSLAGDGNNVYAYPTATRKLNEGASYVVEIPAGSIVDLTGYNPNEEIKLTYNGLYVIQVKPGEKLIYFDDFDDPAQSLNNWMLYEGDHLEPVTEMSDVGFDKDNTPWNFSLRDSMESSDYAACATSMYKNGGKADDWMSTPQLNIDNEFYFLEFDAQGYKKVKEDKLKVIVWASDVTYGTLDANAINKMRTEGDCVFEEVVLPGASDELLEGDWKHYEVSLSKYNGKKIYIAFLNDNTNQSCVFVDNVKVIYRGNFTVAPAMSEYVENIDDMDVTVSLNVTENKTFSEFKATLKNGDDSFTSVFEGKDLNLKQNDIYNFTFPEKLPLVKGKENKYSIVVEMGGEEQRIESSIYNLRFKPERRVVIEEGTGTWCGNCPLGMLALDHIEATFPENVIPVSIHNGDIMAFESYISFMGFSAFPSGRVNRNEKMLQPYSVVNGKYSFESEAGNVTFKDYVLSELEQLTIADVTIDKYAALYNYNMEVEATVKFALDFDKANYNLLTLVLEDNIMALQTNYFSGNNDPFFGEWGTGKYGSAYPYVTYKDVARGIAGGSFYGESGLIPKSVTAGEEYKVKIPFKLPQSVNEPTQTKVVVMLIDPVANTIVNAAICKDMDVTGVDTIIAEAVGPDVKFSVNGGRILMNGSEEGVNVYTLDGRCVVNSNLPAGLYIARGVNGETVAATKIMICR